LPQEPPAREAVGRGDRVLRAGNGRCRRSRSRLAPRAPAQSPRRRADACPRPARRNSDTSTSRRGRGRCTRGCGRDAAEAPGPARAPGALEPPAAPARRRSSRRAPAARALPLRREWEPALPAGSGRAAAGSAPLRELVRPRLVLRADEADEAVHVGAAQLVVRACEPRQLAQVRVAAPPVPLREDGKVVVVRGDDLFAEPLERERARGGDEALEALAEGLEEPLIPWLETFWKRALEPLVERPLRRSAAQENERVVRDADQRRSEHGHERLVVIAVVQE